jgi:hypothetical protein
MQCKLLLEVKEVYMLLPKYIYESGQNKKDEGWGTRKKRDKV